MKERIKYAAKKDVKMILKLVNSYPNLLGDGKTLYGRENIENYLRTRLNKTVVYVIKNKIVGCFIAEFWDNYIHLQSLAVDKNYQGKGIGTKLMHYLEKLAKKQNISRIEALTEVDNKKMNNLFKKMRYKKGDKFIFYSKNLIKYGKKQRA